ncbi:hypothetical protein HDU99_004262, partial [Rhizoclosmatium hyalinum]
MSAIRASSVSADRERRRSFAAFAAVDAGGASVAGPVAAEAESDKDGSGADNFRCVADFGSGGVEVGPDVDARRPVNDSARLRSAD